VWIFQIHFSNNSSSSKDIMTMTAFGYLIVFSIDFYNNIANDGVFVLTENIYHYLENSQDSV